MFILKLGVRGRFGLPYLTMRQVRRLTEVVWKGHVGGYSISSCSARIDPNFRFFFIHLDSSGDLHSLPFNAG
jgi:hypothetical protein